MPETIRFMNETLLEVCFRVFQELRPHLTSFETFCAHVKQQQKEGYVVAAFLEEEGVVACVGYRSMTTLAWGKIIYIDDLIVASSARGKGYGKALLLFVKEQAKQKECTQIHLDTGYHRHAAHRLYLSLGFELNCHHLSLAL